MLSQGESVYIRGNYRTRLSNIKDAIDMAIKRYDKELSTTQIDLRGKKRGSNSNYK